MKTQLTHLLRSKANALLITIILMAILTTTIAGYLKYVQQQTILGSRSQQWNAAMAIAEAGIEEGLEALNHGTSPSFTAADGWSPSPLGNNIYVLHRTLLNGEYYVTNDFSDPSQPTLVSRAFVNMTTYAKGANQFPGFFATAGATATKSPPTRAVKVTTAKGSMILAAMVAKHTIDMNGNWGMTDSFDSGFPGIRSTAGGLYAKLYSSTNGDVASIDGFVSAGNFTIKGDVATGPNGTVTIGSQGQITGTITHDANYTFPQNSFPYSSGICPPGGNILTPSGTNQNIVTNVVNSTTPPPAPSSGQVIIATTNSTSSTSSVWPGNQPNLKTNSNVNISGTNRVITVVSTNYICGTTTYSANTLPANVCSYTIQGSGGGANSYKYTLIVGTNFLYNTNLVYLYTTNYTYTYTTYLYNYTIYASQITYTTNTYDHILCGDYFCPNGLSGNTYVQCPSRLVMTNGWQMSGSDTLTIGSGASLTNYVGGSKLAINGNGIVNKDGLAQNLVVIAADSVTAMDFKLDGNASYTGVFIAPNADVQLNGGGSSSTNDFVGSLMANSIKMNGHFQFHYDEALSRIGGSGRFLITSWREIP